MRARRGIALLTVVLLSALMLITIVGVGYVVVQEKIMVTSEYGFKDALAVAEAGMAQATANIQNASVKDDGTWAPLVWPEIFQLSDIQVIAASGITLRTVTRKVFPAKSSSVITIQVQKMTAGGIVNGALPDGTVIQIMSMGEKYVSPSAAADALTSTPSETTLIGRRVLGATYQLANYTVPDVAMFTGGQIDFKGDNSSVSGDDIFANGDINLQKKGPRLLPPGTYTVYSAGTVSNAATGEIVHDSSSSGGQAPIPFNLPSLASMQQLAYDFRTGTGAYNLMTDKPDVKFAEYPSTFYIKDYLNLFLGGTPVTKDVASNLDQVAALTATLVNDKGELLKWIETTDLIPVNQKPAALLEAGALLGDSAAERCKNLAMATYYVETDKNLTVGTLSALGTIAVLPELSGGKRELKIAGGADVGAWPYADSGFSMIVYGDITGTGKKNDPSRFTGQIMATGDFTGAGNYTVNGQLIVEGSVTASGNFYLKYVKPEGGPPEDPTPAFLLQEGTWKEGSLATFNSFPN